MNIIQQHGICSPDAGKCTSAKQRQKQTNSLHNIKTYREKACRADGIAG